MKCYVNELNNIGRAYHNNDFFDNTTFCVRQTSPCRIEMNVYVRGNAEVPVQACFRSRYCLSSAKSLRGTYTFKLKVLSVELFTKRHENNVSHR